MKKITYSDGRCYGFTLQERFEAKFKINKETGCWEWQAGLTKYGYGSFSKVSGKSLLAHRVSYEIYKGDPSGFLVCHKCDNPPCVNPNHLFLGTHKDNTQDSVIKGRFMSEKRLSVQSKIWETRRNKNPESGKQELKHPSMSAYYNRKCRCEECVKLKTDKSKMYRKTYKAKLRLKKLIEKIE